jgi:two-component system, NarL family, invasion response regulator UvrY
MLALLAKGRTYRHIAQELNVSYKTVVSISWQLKKKLDVDSLPALVQMAMKLMPPTDVLGRSRSGRIAKRSRVIPGTISTFARA